MSRKHPDRLGIGYKPASKRKNLDTTHRECLAVVWDILLLRLYLEGPRTTLRTDHHTI